MDQATALQEAMSDFAGQVYRTFVGEIEVAWDRLIEAGQEPSEMRRRNSPAGFREVICVGPEKTPAFEVFLTVGDVAVVVNTRWLIPEPERRVKL